MTEKENQQSNWLAIASFVLALIWVACCLSIVGSILWIICFILALIFGIIALCKKQTKWAAWIGTIVSGIFLILSTILIVVAGSFVMKHSDVLVTPVTNFAAWVEENPEIATLLKDEKFSEQFEDLLENKLEEKYGENYQDIKDIDWALAIWGDLFEEMKWAITELAENYDVNAITDNWEKDNEELNIVEE